MQVMKADAPERHPTEALQRQAKRLQSFFAALLEPPSPAGGPPFPDLALTPSEVRVLLLLAEYEESTMTALAERVGTPLSTLTRVIDRLERKALVERHRTEEDRRVVVVRSTAASKELYKGFQHAQFLMAKRMLEPLSNGEREILLELIEKLLRGLRSG